MIKARSSQLKAKLGQYLRAVRGGKEVIVHDRETPIARLVPFSVSAKERDEWIVSAKDPAAPLLGSIKIRGIAFRGTDSLGALRKDRAKR